MTSDAGEILRSARTRARLSQTDLARRLGVAQSVISAYESGRREPSFQMLTRLVQATGHQLVLDMVPAPDRTLGLPDTPLGRRLRRRRQAIIDLARTRGVRTIHVVGAVARGDASFTGDIEFVVDIDARAKAAIGSLERDLGELLGVKVTVTAAASLASRQRRDLLAEAIRL